MECNRNLYNIEDYKKFGIKKGQKMHAIRSRIWEINRSKILNSDNKYICDHSIEDSIDECCDHSDYHSECRSDHHSECRSDYHSECRSDHHSECRSEYNDAQCNRTCKCVQLIIRSTIELADLLNQLMNILEEIKNNFAELKLILIQLLNTTLTTTDIECLNLKYVSIYRYITGLIDFKYNYCCFFKTCVILKCYQFNRYKQNLSECKILRIPELILEPIIICFPFDHLDGFERIIDTLNILDELINGIKKTDAYITSELRNGTIVCKKIITIS